MANTNGGAYYEIVYARSLSKACWPKGEPPQKLGDCLAELEKMSDCKTGKWLIVRIEWEVTFDERDIYQGEKTTKKVIAEYTDGHLEWAV